MKLRTKQEASILKSNERKREIDEGKKIAEMIDKLRETKAQEEANLSKFREESLRVINREIEDKLREKSALTVELIGMKTVYEALKTKVTLITSKINQL